MLFRWISFSLRAYLSRQCLGSSVKMTNDNYASGIFITVKGLILVRFVFFNLHYISQLVSYLSNNALSSNDWRSK